MPHTKLQDLPTETCERRTVWKVFKSKTQKIFINQGSFLNENIK